MSNMKKTVAAILAVALMGTALPFSGSSSPLSTPLTASAEEQTTTASLSNGVITLNGNVKKEDVQQYNNNTSVTMVVCGDNVVLPTNSSGLFRYIKAKEIDLSTADTSGVTDMTSMFYECSNLERLNISGFDTSHVTSMSQMFSNCPKLKDVDLNGFDTSNVKRMDWMFNSCKSLSFIDITGFKTNKVENMDYMFAG